jgi:tetratricopeptide (TPR) repeat protein
MVGNFKINNYKSQPAKNGQNSGPPIFAKIIALFIIGLALSIAMSRLYQRQDYKIKHRKYSAPKTSSAAQSNSVRNEAQAWHLRAKSLIKHGKYKEAEAIAQKSLSIDDKFHRAYMDLGVIYSSNGDYVKAEKAFSLALQFIGNDTFDLEIIYADLGLMCLVEKRFNEAWDYFRKAYERKTYLGNDFWADTRLKYVIKDDRNKFIEQATNDKGLPHKLDRRKKRIRALLGRDNDAVIRDCEQFILDNPGSVYTYVFRSLLVPAFLRKGEDEKALEQLKMVESQDLPDYYIPWVKHTYAYIYDKKGEKQRAIDYLKDIIANYPAYESLAEIKEMLARLESKR